MTVRRLILIATAAAFALVAYAYRSAVSPPVVRHAEVRLPGLPIGTDFKVVLLADIHVAGPDMSPRRLSQIVGQVNALLPDLVLIAGDFVSDNRVATRAYSLRQAVAPLAALRPRLGTVAVLGNHDHWRDGREAREALSASGIGILANEAVRVGPLAIGGLDDAFTGRADLGATLRAMAAVGGTPVLLSHSPDPFPTVPAEVGLMVAGHTHCGQIRLPLIGAISYMSKHGDRYACGLVREGGRNLIVSSGLGTSVLPLRLGAAPDIWVVRIRAPAARQGVARTP